MLEYVVTILLLLSICITILILTDLYVKKNLKKSTSLPKDTTSAETEAKFLYVKAALGFDPYESTKVSQLFNKLSETSNTNIKHYLVYSYINEASIPGGNLVKDSLPVESLYDILANITHRQELIFKYK